MVTDIPDKTELTTGTNTPTRSHSISSEPSLSKAGQFGLHSVIALAHQTLSTERDSYPTTECLTHQHDPDPTVPVVESHQRVGNAGVLAAALLLCGVVGLISHAVVASHQTQLRLFALLQQMLMRQAERRIG